MNIFLNSSSLKVVITVRVSTWPITWLTQSYALLITLASTQSYGGTPIEFEHWEYITMRVVIYFERSKLSIGGPKLELQTSHSQGIRTPSACRVKVPAACQYTPMSWLVNRSFCKSLNFPFSIYPSMVGPTLSMVLSVHRLETRTTCKR